MSRITRLGALEILDSRGRPTVEVTCELAGGARATAQVPSGASTGGAEAAELRDGDPHRYEGRGCLRAVGNVTGPIARALVGAELDDQRTLDQRLVDLDGSPDKSNLGANAIIGVSLCFARAAAQERGVPFYQHLAELTGRPARSMPRLSVNLFSGGKHAGGQVAVQDLLVVPVSAPTIAEGLAQVVAVYEAAALGVHERYGARRLTADEGGLAPPFARQEAMFEDAMLAVERSGLVPGEDIAFAVDVAASHFCSNGAYRLEDEPITAEELIDRIADWVARFPIVSVEDGLGEEDWQHWPGLNERLAGKALTLGDDLLCTNPARIQRAIDSGACNALLLKVNQIGTLSEALAALELARKAGWQVTVSARSGETEDHWLADLAVGWGGDQIKVGSVTQSERLSKYNRLLAIEAATGLPVANWPK